VLISQAVPAWLPFLHLRAEWPSLPAAACLLLFLVFDIKARPKADFAFE
jgi:membrane protein YdbS with pleckstrin-like domain